MRIINVLALLAIALSGCSSYSNQFDCPIGSGLKCASLSEVNQKIDEGTWPLESGTKSSCPGCQKVHWREDFIPSQGH